MPELAHDLQSLELPRGECAEIENLAALHDLNVSQWSRETLMAKVNRRKAEPVQSVFGRRVSEKRRQHFPGPCDRGAQHSVVK